MTTTIYGEVLAHLERRRTQLTTELRDVDEAIAAVGKLGQPLANPVAAVKPEATANQYPEPGKRRSVAMMRQSPEGQVGAVERRRTALYDYLVANGPKTPKEISRKIGFPYQRKDLSNDLHRLSVKGLVVRNDDGSGWGVPSLGEKAKPETNPAVAPPAAPKRVEEQAEVVWRPGRDAKSLTGDAAGLGSTLSSQGFVRLR